MIWGALPRYEITITLVPYIAHRHADAREAAARVADAVEQLACADPEFPETQLVELTRLSITRIPGNEEQA